MTDYDRTLDPNEELAEILSQRLDRCREENERLKAKRDQARALNQAAVEHDMLKSYVEQAGFDMLDAQVHWPKGSNGPVAIAAYEALCDRLRLFREQVWQRLILPDRAREAIRQYEEGE